MPALLRAARRLSAASVAAATIVTGLVAMPTPAGAATGISGIKVSAVSNTSFTVTFKSLGSGWRYKVFASTTKSQVYYSNLSKAPYKSAYSSSPKVTLGGLRYTTAVYWWRIQARKGTSSTTSTAPIYSVGLRPLAPTNLSAASTPHQGTSLKWSSGAVTGYQVQQSTDPTFAGATTFSTRRADRWFSPYGMTNGATYFYRVRGVNHGTAGPWNTASPAVSAAAQSQEQAVRVATYNILGLDNDGTQASGSEKVQPWTGTRDVAVSSYISSVHPDVVAIQEGSAFVGSQCSYRQVGTRQIDDLLNKLHGAGLSEYALASTEVRPCLPGWKRTGDYILYDSTKWQALTADCGDQTACKNFDLVSSAPSSFGTQHYAAYELFQSKATGAKFLFVAPHLYVTSGSTGDKYRQQETESMISQARNFAAANGNVPVVYAGDFNSQSKHALDGPAVATRAAGISDGLYSSQVLVNAKYDSANRYMRTPPAFGDSIDHVYVEPGIGLVRWGLYLRLSSGKFSGTIPSDHNLLYADLTLPY